MFMKKVLLFIFAVGLGFTVTAQQVKSLQQINYQKTANPNEIAVPTSQVPVKVNIPIPAQTGKAAAISVTQIGKGPNAFSSAFGTSQGLTSYPDLGVVAFIHRARIGNPAPAHTSGFFSLDVSKDNGATWTTDYGPIWNVDTGNTAMAANGRYPRASIYNPGGGMNPDDAYLAFAAPSLPGFNGAWGGQATGAQKLDLAGPSTQNQINASAGNEFHLNDAFTINQGKNEAWMLTANSPGLAGFNDTLITFRGTWNAGTKLFDYTATKIPFPTANLANFADSKIAFGPSGNVGYIAALTRIDTLLAPTAHFQICVMKTTDGGDTWTAPVQLDLIAATLELRTGAFNIGTGFEIDCTVDANDNLNIFTSLHDVTGVADWSVPSANLTTPDSLFAMFHIMTNADNATPQKITPIYYPNYFRGNVGGLTQDLRPQISRTFSGNKVFMTCFDTDSILQLGDNSAPDAICQGYDVDLDRYSDDANDPNNAIGPTNFTRNTVAYTFVVFGMAADYVLEPNQGEYEIPMSYMSLAPSMNELDTTNYWYISGATFTDNDFGLGFNDLEIKDFSVSQNYPNPFNNITNIDVNLEVKADLTLEISNMLGQVVFNESKQDLIPANHTFSLDASNLEPGIYFYTVTVNGQSISKKMMVK